MPFAREPFVPDLDPSTAGRPTPLGTHLAELIWFRSLTGAAHPYVEHARTGRFVTFGDLRRATTRWAGLLDDLGIGSGDTVGIAVADAVDFSMVFLGVVAAGRVAAPLDPAAPDAELASVCGRVRPAVVLSDRTGPAGLATDWIVLRSGSFDLPDAELPDGAPGWAPTLGTPSTLGMSATPRPADGGLVLSTSGTTGTPKLIRLTDRQLLHTARAIARHHRLSARRPRLQLPPALPHQRRGRRAARLARRRRDRSSSTTGSTGRPSGPIWPAPRHVDQCRAGHHRPARPAGGRRGRARGIRFVRSASAPLPVPTLRRFEDATGLPIVETYGMTEAGEPDHRQPVGRPAQAGLGRPAGRRRAPRRRRRRGRHRPRHRRRSTGEPVAGRVEIRGPGVIGAYAGDRLRGPRGRGGLARHRRPRATSTRTATFFLWAGPTTSSIGAGRRSSPGRSKR